MEPISYFLVLAVFAALSVAFIPAYNWLLGYGFRFASKRAPRRTVSLPIAWKLKLHIRFDEEWRKNVLHATLIAARAGDLETTPIYEMGQPDRCCPWVSNGWTVNGVLMFPRYSYCSFVQLRGGISTAVAHAYFECDTILPPPYVVCYEHRVPVRYAETEVEVDVAVEANSLT